MRVMLATPATNERGPRYMEKALAAMHQANPDARPITLEYGCHEGKVALFLQAPDGIEAIVTAPIIANYPAATLTQVSPLPALPAGWQSWSADLRLAPDLFPILRHPQFEDLLNGTFADPIAGILRAIQPDPVVNRRVEIRVTPLSRKRHERALRAVKRLDRSFFRIHHRLARFYAEHVTTRHGFYLAWPLGMLAPRDAESYRSAADVSSGRLHDREDDVQAASDKIGGHLFAVQMRLVVEAPAGSDQAALASIRQMAGAFGAFTTTRLSTFRLGAICRGESLRVHGRTWIASHSELATLVHPPTSSTSSERMQTQEFTELEAPVVLHSPTEEGAAVLGRVRFRDDRRIAVIGSDDLKRHVYVVGATGCGKSTLLLNQIRAHMASRSGLTVLDVHGDLIEAALGVVPAHRTNEVIVFDAAGDSIVPFNPLACPDPSRIDQVTSGVVSAFRKLYDSWGPRLESLLRFSVFAMVEQGGTLQLTVRFLTDEGYREQIVPRIRDDVARAFWLHEFQSWNRQYRTEAVSSVTNKVLPFLANSRLRAITAGGPRSLNLRSVMDEGSILLVNLSRGRLGQDNATLLGSLLLTSIEQAALARAELAESERRTHHLFLDEFQSIVTPSIGIVLSEGRKFGVSLTLSHQMTSQLDGPTRSAVLGNCGTLVAFRVGLEDADLLAPAFSKFPGQLKAQDMTGLPNFTAYTRLLVDGLPSAPFSLATLQSPICDIIRRDTVRNASARRYGSQNFATTICS